LERIVKTGPDKCMVRLMAPGNPISNPRETYPIMVGGVPNAGCVTSIAYSPRLKLNVGLGYVPPGAAVTGTSILIDAPEGKVEGQIANNDWQVSAD